MNTHVRHNFSQRKGRMVSLLRLAPDFPASFPGSSLWGTPPRHPTKRSEPPRRGSQATSPCRIMVGVWSEPHSACIDRVCPVDLSYFEIPCPFQLLFKKETQTDLKTWRLYLHLLYRRSVFFFFLQLKGDWRVEAEVKADCIQVGFKWDGKFQSCHCETRKLAGPLFLPAENFCGC